MALPKSVEESVPVPYKKWAESLPPATGFNDSDIVVVIQGGVPKRTTWGAIASQNDAKQSLSFSALSGVLSITGGNVSKVLDPYSASIAGSGTFQIPAGRLIVAIVAIPVGNQTFKIGTTSGGSEIYEEAFSAGGGFDNAVVPVWRYTTGNLDIHLTASNCLFKFYLR